MGQAARRIAVVRRRLHDAALRADEWVSQNLRRSRSVAVFVQRASAGGGLTVALISLTRMLARRGYRVALVELKPSDDPPVRPIDPRVERLAIPETAPIEGELQPLLHRFQPDYIYTADFGEDVVRAIRKAAPIGTVLIFGDHDARRATQAAADELPPHYLFAVREFDAIHSVNEEASEVARLGTCRPVFTIPNPSPRPIRRKRSIFRSRKVVVLARLAEGKHVDDAIYAFDKVAPEFRKWNLEIYGRGPERASLVELIRSMPSRRRIRLMRFTRDVFNVLSDSAIMVSASEAEAFSFAYLEAMAAGCTIVSYDGHMGARAVLRHDLNAFLAQHLDRDALARQLSRVMTMIETRSSHISAVQRSGRSTVDILREERIARHWDLALRRLPMSARG